MNIELTDKLIFNESAALVIFCNNEKVFSECFIKEGLELAKDRDILDKFGSVADTRIVCEKSGAKQDLIVVSIGNRDKLSREDIRILSSKIYNVVKSKNLYLANIDIRGIENKTEDIISSINEGISLTAYSFDKYYSDKKDNKKMISFNLITSKRDRKELEESIDITYSVNRARDLINEVPNVLSPKKLGEIAKEEGDLAGFTTKIYDKKEIEKMKMGSYLAVAQGSDNEPNLIVMRYEGDKSKPLLGLVGKGVTYDTGGHSLKPRTSMLTMKTDMGGAAAVIGTMIAIAKQKLPVNVVGVVAACDNMISNTACRPDDVVTSMSGKTIEIVNTDAEGRLTLADAIHYAISVEKATKIVDLATLTGACIIALGDITTGVMTNNQDLYKKIKDASKISGEEIWELPSRDEYKFLLKSSIADITNSSMMMSSSGAQAIGAGMFIKEFVGNTPWVHMDIAGTSRSSSDKDYIKLGGTGVGIRTLYRFIKDSN